MTPVSPDITRAARALLATCYSEAGELEVDRVIEVIRTIGSQRLEKKLVLAKTFGQLAAVAWQQQCAVVTVAQELPEVEREKIGAAVRAAYPQAKVVSWQVDPELIGGLTVLVGDHWYEASVRRRLEMVKERLSR